MKEALKFILVLLSLPLSYPIVLCIIIYLGSQAHKSLWLIFGALNIEDKKEERREERERDRERGEKKWIKNLS